MREGGRAFAEVQEVDEDGAGGCGGPVWNGEAEMAVGWVDEDVLTARNGDVLGAMCWFCAGVKENVGGTYQIAAA